MRRSADGGERREQRPGNEVPLAQTTGWVPLLQVDRELAERLSPATLAAASPGAAGGGRADGPRADRVVRPRRVAPALAGRRGSLDASRPARHRRLPRPAGPRARAPGDRAPRSRRPAAPVGARPNRAVRRRGALGGPRRGARRGARPPLHGAGRALAGDHRGALRSSGVALAIALAVARDHAARRRRPAHPRDAVARRRALGLARGRRGRAAGAAHARAPRQPHLGAAADGHAGAGPPPRRRPGLAPRRRPARRPRRAARPAAPAALGGVLTPPPPQLRPLRWALA